MASSVVGTPGANRAGEIIGQAVTGAAQKVERVAFDAALERQEAKEAAAANKSSIDLDMKFDEIERDHRSKYADFRGDPQERVTALRSALEDGFKGITDTLPQGNTRTAVDKYGYGAIRERINRESNYADVNQATLAFTDAQEATRLLGVRAGEIARSADDPRGKQLQLQSLMKRGETTYAIASKIVSPENHAKLKTLIPQTISKGYLDAVVDANPTQMEDALEKFGGFLTEQEKTKYRDDAQKSFTQRKEKADMAHLMGTIDENGAQYDKYLAGTLTYADIQNMTDKRAAATLNELRLKTNTTTSAEKYSNYLALYDEYIEMVKDAGTKNAKVKKQFSLENVIDLQSRILQQINDEQIDSGLGGSLMKNLNSPLNKKVKKQQLDGWFSDFKEMSVPFQMAFSYVRNEGKKGKVPDSVQADALIRFDQELAALGENPKPSAIGAAIKKAWDETVVASNPKRSAYKVGDVVDLNGAPYEVTGFDPDGEPRVKPVEKKK